MNTAPRQGTDSSPTAALQCTIRRSLARQAQKYRQPPILASSTRTTRDHMPYVHVYAVSQIDHIHLGTEFYIAAAQLSYKFMMKFIYIC